MRITHLARIWLTASILVLSSGCACHTHLLGTIEDQATAKPIAGVHVRLETTDAEAETNAWGEFEVDAICRKAPYAVAITAPGYEDLREEVDLGDHEVWRTFHLVPAGKAPPTSGTRH